MLSSSCSLALPIRAGVLDSSEGCSPVSWDLHGGAGVVLDKEQSNKEVDLEQGRFKGCARLKAG